MFVRNKTVWILFVLIVVMALDVGANNLTNLVATKNIPSVNIIKNKTTAINEHISENPQTTPHEVHFVSKKGDTNIAVNLQNVSRTTVTETATVTASLDLLGAADSVTTSMQMNKTEMFKLTAQEQAPCKLPQTIISSDSKNTTENGLKINEGVHHIKLAELVHDREHKHAEKPTTNTQSLGNLRTKLTSNEVQHKENDFTGKLLEEEDGGIISEIEQKFRINELSTKTPELHGTLERLDAAIEKIFTDAAAKEGTIEPQYTVTQVHQVFLDRRVKKSFDFPTHHVTLPMPSTTTTNDFAKTKFSNGSLGKTHTHPEFSTTKFYNSKELYNEMLSNKNNTLNATEKNNNYTDNTDNKNNKHNYQQSQILSKQYAVLTNPKFKTFRKSKDMNLPSYAPPTAAYLSTITEITNSVSSYGKNNAISATTTTTTSPLSTTDSGLQMPAAHGEVVSAEVVPTQTEAKDALERAKWHLKAILPVATSNKFSNNNNKNIKNNYHNTQIKSTFSITTDTPSALRRKPVVGTTLREINTTTTTTGYVKGKAKISATSRTTTSIPPTKSTISTTIVKQRIKTRPTTTATTTTNSKQVENITKTNSYTSTASLSQHRTTNPTKSSSKPISRPRILSQLQLKINALECEIANISPVAHLWRGNETHELLLPIMVSK